MKHAYLVALLWALTGIGCQEVCPPVPALPPDGRFTVTGLDDLNMEDVVAEIDGDTFTLTWTYEGEAQVAVYDIETR